MVRAAIKRNLYYSYRFLSEFSGKAIDLYDVAGFQNVEWDGNSLSKCYFEGLPSAISETKQQIDTTEDKKIPDRCVLPGISALFTGFALFLKNLSCYLWVLSFY